MATGFRARNSAGTTADVGIDRTADARCGIVALASVCPHRGIHLGTPRGLAAGRDKPVPYACSASTLFRAGGLDLRRVVRQDAEVHGAVEHLVPGL